MAELRVTWDSGLVEDVPVERNTFARSRPEVVRRALIKIHPLRASRTHIYVVKDPEKGLGRAEVGGLDKNELRRLSEMIQIVEVSRKIGMEEPYYMDELPVGMQGIALRAPNPYNQMFLAAVFMGAGALSLWAALVQIPGFSAVRIIILCIGIILVGGGTWVFVRGWKRRVWWHAARAQVKRDGEKMPELLRVFF